MDRAADAGRDRPRRACPRRRLAAYTGPPLRPARPPRRGDRRRPPPRDARGERGARAVNTRHAIAATVLRSFEGRYELRVKDDALVLSMRNVGVRLHAVAVFSNKDDLRRFARVLELVAGRLNG